MTLKILRTKKDYLAAIERFEKIFQFKAGTPESDEADVLELLIRQYEDKHYIIEAPTPLEAIRYRMEQQGFNNKDLIGILGHKSRVTDLFKNKSRKLTIDMIRKLHEHFQIPLESLIREY